ncbi:hypothetical protein LTR37_017190 [Vermiconidia calcicola]|uniref:Uncharacterized protein n=1 Tax=Vermiconidia calcicola TaxID=1690605 RepID=A0ACC3MKU4_9PEZI|nr:hypothetical protein LTR37_017190 [Vermiconidia calcicola]
MSAVLRSLAVKLKRRRKSSAGRSHTERQAHEAGKGEGQDISSLMDGLTIAPSPDTRSYQFGNLKDYEFDFVPVPDRPWPGPTYDKCAPFAPGVFDKPRPTKRKSKLESTKREVSTQEVVKENPRRLPSSNTQHGRSVARSKHRRPLQYYGAPPARDPPVDFLNLPGEIRNYILRLLCVGEEPIVAQFRPVLEPSKDGRRRLRSSSEKVRRFPREPVLALGCRQLQREVLSIFYGENKFIFRQSEAPKSTNLVMTCTETIQKWSPTMADCLAHFGIHFIIRPLHGGKKTINYELCKLVDGRLRISNNVESQHYCTCFDKHMLEAERLSIASGRVCRNLIYEAKQLISKRANKLQHDSTMEPSPGSSTSFRPWTLKCNDCGLEHLRMLESGL